MAAVSPPANNLRARGAFMAASVLVLAYLASVLLRPNGSYIEGLDGWGVDALEVGLAGLCASRYLTASWRSSRSSARVFPLVLGLACLSWACGDIVNTILTGNGTSPAVSAADGLWLAFYPACYLSFMLVIRRGHGGTLAATALDGLIAGLGSATLAGAFLFSRVLHDTGTGATATSFNLAFPLGDLLLLALAVGGTALLTRAYRPFLFVAGIAMVANVAGDGLNLLAPTSEAGYVANAVAWPVSLLLLALATWVQPTAAVARTSSAEKAAGDRSAGLLLPSFGALAGLAVLVAYCAGDGHVGRVSVGLATAALCVAGVRVGLVMRDARALKSARFRSLIDNAWDLIVVAEVDLTIAYVTPSSERVLGCPPAELTGRRLGDLLHPDDQPVAHEHLARLLRGAPTTTFETRARRSDGAWRIVAWTASNQLEDPSVGGLILNGTDVTEARHAAADLAGARDAAVQASKAKSEFLSVMSHEIRTPMNGVIGLTDLLLTTALDSEQRELAAGVRLSAENLLVIINDILDFSKIEAGKLDIEEVPFSVAEVAGDVGRMLAATAYGKGLELLVDVAPDVPERLVGDPVRIQQVLLNLTGNAVKFTSVGEVVVQVAVTGSSAGHVTVRFEVRDTGMGIAPVDLDRLWQPFSQADSSTTRRFGGTGLGLAISRQLVDLMGGSIGAESEPGSGSTFAFELTLDSVAEPGEGSAGAGPQAVRGLEGLRALVVDDNATNRRILDRQLRSWGVDVDEAADAYAGLALAGDAVEAGRPHDLAVIDLHMPGMDGMELAGLLQAAGSRTAMVLLTSSGSKPARHELALHGFRAALIKPVRGSELYDCLVEAVNPDAAAAATAAGTGGAAAGLVGTSLAEGAPAGAPGGSGLILLVEDNEMNRLVGSKVLGKLGYAFEVACHGGEAVAAVRRRRFDAVLMDCQMPVMDGFEATLAIRRLEGDRGHTPVIAMTASAMDEDRERCRAAGMDDFLSKPVRPEDVGAVLRTWVPQPGGVDDDDDGGGGGGGGGSAAAAAAAVAGVVASGGGGAGGGGGVVSEGSVSEAGGDGSDAGLDGVLDGAQIELLQSLDDGVGEVLAEIVEQYLAQTDAARIDLARVLGEGDAVAAGRVAHTLRGASVNVGATHLAALCTQIEERARAADLACAPDLVARFDAELQRVRLALAGLPGCAAPPAAADAATASAAPSAAASAAAGAAPGGAPALVPAPLTT